MKGRRALLVGAAPARQGSLELVTALASAADAVIAVDGGAALCLEAGILPEVVIGDFDSAPSPVLDAARKGGSELIRYPAEKDETDLDLALRHTRERGFSALTATGVLSARVDHTLAATGSLCRVRGMAVDVVETDLSGWVLNADETDALLLKGPDSTLSLMSVLGSAVVSVSGVRWPLARHRLEPASSLGVSNVITGDLAAITVHEGTAIVLSPQVGKTKPAGKISRNTP